jgi:hypothetical protein
MRMKDTLDARASETISDLQCQVDALKAENENMAARMTQIGAYVSVAENGNWRDVIDNIGFIAEGRTR